MGGDEACEFVLLLASGWPGLIGVRKSQPTSPPSTRLEKALTGLSLSLDSSGTLDLVLRNLLGHCRVIWFFLCLEERPTSALYIPAHTMKVCKRMRAMERDLGLLPVPFLLSAVPGKPHRVTAIVQDGDTSSSHFYIQPRLPHSGQEPTAEN